VTISRASTIKIIKSQGLALDKRLGQNFLVEESYIEKIIKTATIKDNETILEIGAGIGNLTSKIAEFASRIVSVEIDQRLIPVFLQVTSEFPNVEIVQGDILTLDLMKLISGEYKVIANIPYYISTAVTRFLTESNNPPGNMILTLQKEVAERMCQKPGNFSLLALSVQIFGEPKIALYIPAGAFYPKPEVDSAVIRIDRHLNPVVPDNILPLLFRLARAGFSQKRKTLRNSLAGGMHWNTDLTRKLLLKAGIEPIRRAEELGIDEWARLSKVVTESGEILPG